MEKDRLTEVISEVAAESDGRKADTVVFRVGVLEQLSKINKNLNHIAKILETQADRPGV